MKSVLVRESHTALLGDVLLPIGNVIRYKRGFSYVKDLFPSETYRCCYIIWDGLSERPVYIGKTTVGAVGRIDQHRYGDYGSGPSELGRLIAQTEPYSWDWIVEVVFPKNFGWEDFLEKELIQELKPWINRHLVGWNSSDIEKPWWFEI